MSDDERVEAVEDVVAAYIDRMNRGERFDPLDRTSDGMGTSPRMAHLIETLGSSFWIRMN